MSNTNNRKNFSNLRYVYSENNALSIIFQDNALLSGVLGEFNNNIKYLEDITQVKIYSRGNSILVKSDPDKNDLVKNAIKFLADQFLNNGTIEKKDVVSSVNKFMIGQKHTFSEKNIDYIIKRIDRSYEKISQFILTLDRYSLKKGSPFGLKLIKEVLKMI